MAPGLCECDTVEQRSERKTKDFFVLRIGANDGFIGDPIHKFIFEFGKEEFDGFVKWLSEDKNYAKGEIGRKIKSLPYV